MFKDKSFKRSIVRSVGALHDLLMACCAITGSFLLVIGFERTFHRTDIIAQLAAYTAIAAVIFPLFKLNRGDWRYASLMDIQAIVKATTVIVALYLVGNFLAFRGIGLPRSVPVIAWFVTIIALGAPRLVYRILKESSRRGDLPWKRVHSDVKNVLLAGMNAEADLYIRSIAHADDNQVKIRGILDNIEKNRHRVLHGIPVLGKTHDLTTVCRRLADEGRKVGEIVVTNLKLDRADLNDVVRQASALEIKIVRLPSLRNPSQIDPGRPIETKPIHIEDLLGRARNELEASGVDGLITAKTVLVTGAGGSIGSELCKQIAGFRPERLILVENSEFALYTIDLELRRENPNLEVIARIGDVRDRSRIERLFQEIKPQIVFHAAALKHVPLMEENPLEAIATNILGTRNLAAAAVLNNVPTFVMVSTDKAVNPTNLMGATKRAAEAHCQALDLATPTTHFVTVRFGNVLGSNGSVVPLFTEQLARGGPLTVTHPDITRYFMTIPEAVRLILRASVFGSRPAASRGHIFVLDMGEPIRIADLAERMIQLAGLRPNIDVKIVYSGLRPGEKLYEELFETSEIVANTGEDGFYSAAPRVIDAAVLSRAIANIEQAYRAQDLDRAIHFLKHIVPEYQQKPLAVEPQQVVLGEAEAADWRL